MADSLGRWHGPYIDLSNFFMHVAFSRKVLTVSKNAVRVPKIKPPHLGPTVIYRVVQKTDTLCFVRPFLRLNFNKY